MPVYALVAQAAVGAGGEQRQEVPLHAREDGLGFGVAEAAIELDDFGAVARNDQARVEHAAIEVAVFGHAVDRRAEHAVLDSREERGRDQRRG